MAWESSYYPRESYYQCAACPGLAYSRPHYLFQACSNLASHPLFSVLGFLFMLRESLSCSRYSTGSSPKALMTSLNATVGRFAFIAEVELASNTQRTRQCEAAMKHEIVDC